MVIVSGSTISRAIFSFDSWCPCPFRRWVRRRNAATERVRSSSAAVAVATVSRPRLRCSEPRVGRAVGNITLPAGAETAGRRMTRFTSSGSTTAGRTGAAGALVVAVGAAAMVPGLRPKLVAGAAEGSPPARRRRASSSDCRLKLASWARRCSSSRLRASAASRSAFSRASRSRRALASASWRRRSSSSRARASFNARARASRCSSVKVGRTTPVLGGAGDGPTVGPRGAVGVSTIVALGAAAADVAAAGVDGASRGDPSPGPNRRLTFSTTTALLRPCEKLCRTMPCSTGRLRCKVAFGAGAPKVLSPLLFVSLMRCSTDPVYSRLVSKISLVAPSAPAMAGTSVDAPTPDR